MKINKKYIAFLAILLVLIIIPVSEVQAAKLECSEIPVDNCPSPGIDGYGKACKKAYVGSEMICTFNTDPKTCEAKFNANGTCPNMDDFGNTCKQEYDGKCHIEKKAEYKELKTCSEYTYQEGCPKEDYKGNTCDRDSQGQCYVVQNNTSCENITSASICKGRSNCIWQQDEIKAGYDSLTTPYHCHSIEEIKTSTETCGSITDRKLCDRYVNDCKWLTPLGSNKSYCGTLIQPTDDSPACTTITNYETCKLRTDCDYGEPNSKGQRCQSIVTTSSEPCSGITESTICNARTDCVRINGICTTNSEYLRIVNGTSLIENEVPFKCSDVKYLTGAWLLIRILAPFLIILFGSLDFFKSMVASDEKEMKKSRGKFIKRLIAFALLIFLPFLVQFIFSNIGTYGSENICLVKCIVTNDTSSKGCD